MALESCVTREIATSEQSERALQRRIQGEFEEMPGLKLTLRQASRLFNVDGTTCERLLARLVASGALRLSDGSFVLSQPRNRWQRFR